MAKVSVDDVRRHLRHKAAAVADFMNSPVGKSVVTALEHEFAVNPFDPDPYVTARNCGRMDVIDYLHQLQRHDKRLNDNPENEDNATGST